MCEIAAVPDMREDGGQRAFGISCQWEPIGLLLQHGLDDMVRRHWADVGGRFAQFPCAPNWPEYQVMEQQKKFAIVAVRHNGHLIGYAAVSIFNSLQSRDMVCAYIQAYYIEPAFRRGGTGLKLFLFIRSQLKALKVDYVSLELPDDVATARPALLAFFTKTLGYSRTGFMLGRCV